MTLPICHPDHSNAAREQALAQIDQQRSGRVLVLTINRPEKKNALNDAMHGQLADALEAARTDPEVRCILVTGAGDTFCAGNDMGDFARVAAGDIKQLDRNVHRVLNVLASCEKPIVAAVPGLAIGIGTTMLLHCDLVFLAEGAMLSVPFVDLAIVPEAASSILLPASVGYVRAFSMFALGERVDAQSALAWGLANKVVPLDELHGVAMAAAEALAAKPPGAVLTTKALMRDPEGLRARIAAEGKAYETRLASPEAAEAFAAFAERRKPDFSRF